MIAPSVIAAQLLGRPPESVEPVRRGGNNRVFKVTAEGVQRALKLYPTQAEDPRDRLGQEWEALVFLNRHAPGRSPAAIARDAGANAALYGWVEGAAPEAGSNHTDAMAAFFLDLQALRPLAGHLRPGSTPVFGPAEAGVQFRERLAAIRGVEALSGHLDRVEAAWSRLSPAWTEAAPQRVLSPSDFGLHNMLLGANGPVFLDFEYFGWDGPEKAIADAMFHPGSAFAPDLGAGLADKLIAGLEPSDPGLPFRFEAAAPLFGLIWCLILLNEFRPDRMARRGLDPASPEARSAQARQLAKSQALLERLT